MTEDQKKAIREEAQRRGLSVAEVLQEVVEERLRTKLPELDYDPFDPNRERSYGRDHY